MIEFHRWVNDHHPPESSNWSKGFWGYCELIDRFMGKCGVESAEVVGTYLERTPPPTEDLLMPVVRIACPTAFFVIQFSFGHHGRPWTVGVVTYPPFRQPTYGLFDEDVDVRRIGAPGFPEDMLYESLRCNTGRFTCQLQDEWDVAMLLRLVLHGPNVPEGIIQARSGTAEKTEDATIWVAGPSLRRCKANTVEAALGMGLLPSDSRLEQLEATGRIFGIIDGIAMLYPTFQFDTGGRPLPVIGGLIDELDRVQGTTVSGWTLAHWLTAHTQSLGGACALDVVLSEPGAVIDALRKDLLRLPPRGTDDDH